MTGTGFPVRSFMFEEVKVAIIASIAASALICLVLWEGFEIIILPRRVIRRFRLPLFFLPEQLAPQVRMLNFTL